MQGGALGDRPAKIGWHARVLGFEHHLLLVERGKPVKHSTQDVTIKLSLQLIATKCQQKQVYQGPKWLLHLAVTVVSGDNEEYGMRFFLSTVEYLQKENGKLKFFYFQLKSLLENQRAFVTVSKGSFISCS